MIKKILLVIVVLVVCICGYAAFQPDNFSVERHIAINAPADKIFANINDFHAWQAWSPWAKLDPAMKLTIAGAPNGKGATYDWEGNSDVGKGHMEITDATAPSKVVIKLDFMTPFESHNVTEFTMAPAATSTDVTWLMHGPSPYVSKLMGVFMSMDKLIGKDFENGLTNLKAVAEK